jgi:hypothetical protein
VGSVADRSLVGVLLIALVGSSFLYLALSSGEGDIVSVLEIRVPDRITYSDEEYHVVASLVALREIAEVDVRFHWLAPIRSETMEEMRIAFGVQSIDIDREDLLDLLPRLREVWRRSKEIGGQPGILDLDVTRGGAPYRIVLYTFGPVQEAFMPARIGDGEGARPVVSGDYAVLINESGHLAGFYVGYPAFFYDVERTLVRVEVGLDGGKSTYENRSAESSLPRLRDLPLIGRLRLPLEEGDRLDLLIAIEGRSVRLWRPALCVTEIICNGELLDKRTFFT